MRVTRRALLTGTTGLVVLGCGGLGGAPGEEQPARPKVPSRRPDGSAGEPGTAFLVRQAEELPNLVFAEPPAWLAAAPAIWSAGGGGLAFLPTGAGPAGAPLGVEHLELARRHGTSVVLTTADPVNPRPVVDAGGHVIVALDPLVLPAGDERGPALRIPPTRPEEGAPVGPFDLCPAHAEVRAHASAEVARRATAGASAVWLLGVGRSRTEGCSAPDHGHPPLDPAGLDEAERTLIEELATRGIPVLCEHAERTALLRSCPAVQVAGIHHLSTSWAWRAAGRVVVPVPGWSIDDLHQALALGHRLALGGEEPGIVPDGTCEDAVEAARAALGDPSTPEDRRRAAERAFRALHRWRNAALLVGRGMPDVDQATPRPGDRPEAFHSAQALDSLLDEVQQKAREVDLALVGVGELPALEPTLRALLEARAAFQAVVGGATVRVLEPGHPTVLAYAFDGPGGRGASAVNLGGRDAAVPIHLPDGSYRELVGGVVARASGGALRADLLPHSLSLWIEAR